MHPPPFPPSTTTTTVSYRRPLVGTELANGRFITASIAAAQDDGLSDGNFIVDVRAWNGYGGATVVSSGQIQQDSVPVTIFNVWDDSFRRGQDEGFSSDPGGVCVYFEMTSNAYKTGFCVGATPGACEILYVEPSNATSADATRKCFNVTVTMVSGRTYYITVIAVTELSQLTTTMSSNGFVFDNVDPVVPVPEMGKRECDYGTDNPRTVTSLDAVWPVAAADAHAGVQWVRADFTNCSGMLIASVDVPANATSAAVAEADARIPLTVGLPVCVTLTVSDRAGNIVSRTSSRRGVFDRPVLTAVVGSVGAPSMCYGEPYIVNDQQDSRGLSFTVGGMTFGPYTDVGSLKQYAIVACPANDTSVVNTVLAARGDQVALARFVPGPAHTCCVAMLVCLCLPESAYPPARTRR
jgi:hypothetical protein